MYYFDYPHFSPTKVKSVDTEVVFYDENLKNYLMEAALFIKKISLHQEKFPLSHFIKNIKELHSPTQMKGESDDIEIHKLLKTISFISNPSDRAIFSTETEFNDFYKGLILFSERFQSAFEIANSGSSRHLFLKGIDIKGAGRNKLANRLDYSHSSGCATLNELLQDLFYGHLLDASLPLGAEKVCAISKIENSTHYLCFRSRSSMRLCNATVKLSFRESVKAFDALIQTFGSARELLSAHIITLSSGLLNGLRHGALNAENALICGKIIDSQTFIVENQVNCFHFSIQIMVLNKSGRNLSFDDLIEAIENNPSDFLLAHNDCFNYVNHINMLQSSLSINSDYKSIDSIELWCEVMRDYFEFLDTHELAVILNALNSLQPGQYSKSIKCLKNLSDSTSIEFNFDATTGNYQMLIKIAEVTSMDSELIPFKKSRLKDISNNLKKLQVLVGAKLKFDLDTSKTSQDILDIISKSVLIPHYHFINRKLIRNRFTRVTAIEIFNNLGLDSNHGIGVFSLSGEPVAKLKVSDLKSIELPALIDIACDSVSEHLPQGLLAVF